MTPQQKTRWRIIWTVWLGLLIVSFAVLEALAWNDGITLSRYVSDLSEAWPLIIFVAGTMSGGLAVHFWWHWDPRNPEDHRG